MEQGAAQVFFPLVFYLPQLHARASSWLILWLLVPMDLGALFLPKGPPGRCS